MHGVLGCSVAGHQHELVAAQPRHQVGLSALCREPGVELSQDHVAPVVAATVVDLLEAVEVDQEQGEAVRSSARASATASAVSLEQGLAVRQAGQHVVRGLVFELGGGMFSLADIAGQGDELGPIGGRNPHGADLDREGGAVAAGGARPRRSPSRRA